MTLGGDRLHRKSGGFSVLELTLALAIVGVLLAVLLPAAAGWQDSAKFKAALNTTAGLAQAIHQDREATGTWPTAWTDLSGRYLSTPSPTTTAWGGSFALTATPG